MLDFLPPKPVHSHRWLREKAGILSWSWDAPLDRPLEQSAHHAIQICGRPRSGDKQADETALHSHFSSKKTAAAFDGGFSFVSVNSDNVWFARGLSGQFPVYWREIESGILISNRISLLFSIGPDPKIDQRAVAWLAGRGYLPAEFTTYQDVNRLMPGQSVHVSKGGFHVTRPAISDMVNPVTTDQVLDLLMTARSNHIRDFETLPDAALEFSLSGGKDSRAIFEMARKSGRLDDRATAYTSGELYSPEVLSAQDICQSAKFAGHQLRRPTLAHQTLNLPSLIANTIEASEGMLSLFDTMRIVVNKRVAIGGHQNGLRGTFFNGLKVGSAGVAAAMVEHYTPDPSNVLTHNALDEARVCFSRSMRHLQSLGVSEDKLPLAFMWFVRTHGWVSVTSNTNTCVSNEMHPLLDFDLISLALRMPHHLVDAEVIHFALTASDDAKLQTIPFAQQSWTERLPDALRQIGWRGPKAERIAPYEYLPVFPNGGHPFVTNAKLQLLDLLEPWMRIAVEAFPDVVKTDDAMSRISQRKSTTSLKMIGLLGLATIGLISQFGRDIFRASGRKKIVETLRPAAPATTIKTRTIEDDDKIIDAYETSIGSLVRELQKRHSTFVSAAPAKPWRHIEISNRSGRKVLWSVEIDDTKTSPRELEASGTFTLGVRTYGKAQLFAKDTNQEITVPFELRESDSTISLIIPPYSASKPLSSALKRLLRLPTSVDGGPSAK
ncbi:hypothetical protein CAK95_24360 [Pseudorhodoplanes sinuspersici]|uniref:Asparagine synthetase domain-containing protein n=1 Tax=Pseudorhodoplanes sinuspersici TaxID=1235591 RepID=A0A1W6ZX70_9HYPH|nr:hypothetical protein CAK95_24360 [Pseudorhodoplanes sinuspersici]